MSADCWQNRAQNTKEQLDIFRDMKKSMSPFCGAVSLLFPAAELIRD